MKQFYFCLPIISVLFFSCNQQENSPNTIIQTITIKRDSLPKIEEFEGLYFPSKNGSRGVIEINYSVGYPVEDETNSLDSLYKKILPNAYPYQKIYIKVEGKLLSSLSQAEPITLHIKSVLKTELKNYQKNCIPYEYWCMGNEPFWQVQISEKENLIDFYDPMGQKTVHFDFTKSQIKNGYINYSAKNNSNAIEIKIKKETCSDGMSEKKYNFSVSVQLNDKTYKGCAVAFGEVIQ